MIESGDYVKTKDTGRYGEVQEKRGKKALVSFCAAGEEEPREEWIPLSRLEYVELPEVDAETARKVVRGETELSALTHGLDAPLDLRPGEAYTVTAEDLLEGLRKKDKDPENAMFWVWQLLWWNDREGGIWPEGSGEPLLCGETAVLCAFELLNSASDAWYNEEPEEFSRYLRETESVLEAWRTAGSDLSRAGEYPDAMLRWMTDGDDDESIDARSGERQETFRACLDALCARGDRRALEKRGYCYYCGTKIYPQDWVAARDGFTGLYEQTGEAWIANTLGYIYYYGRCSGGVPDYGEAFRWFSVGYAGGIHESTYKLGDLYAGGLGVVKNRRTAYALYRRVYDDTLDRFLAGDKRSKFADAAIRMGHCYRDGTGCLPDSEQAYGYYLQARLALEIRMEAGATFGDGSVKERLDKAIREIREIYTDRERLLRGEEPFFLEWILDRDRCPARMAWKPLKDGKFSLVFTRAPDTAAERNAFLVTFPAGDYCGLQRKVTVQTEKGASLNVKGDAREVLFDSVENHWWDHCLVLMRTGETVAEIRTDGYCFRVPALSPAAPGAEEV